MLFLAFKLPAAWLSGGMLGVVILVLAGVRVECSNLMRDVAMLFAGVAMGCSITPEMVQAMARYPLSLIFLVLTIIGIVFASKVALVRIFGWKADVAVVASVPGAMSAVIATAAAGGMDMTRVAIVQAFRMLVLMVVLPSLVVSAAAMAPPIPVPVISPLGFGVMVGLAFLIGLVFERLNVLAPLLFAGMTAGAMTHVTGNLEGVPPASIVDGAMFLIGIYAGSRVAGTPLSAFRALFLPALVSFLVTMVVTLIGAGLAIGLAGAAPAEALIAFAPGGLEAMMVLGVVMGLDPLYLSSHHVIRFALISFALPVLGRFMFK